MLPPAGHTFLFVLVGSTAGDFQGADTDRVAQVRPAAPRPTWNGRAIR